MGASDGTPTLPSLTARRPLHVRIASSAKGLTAASCLQFGCPTSYSQMGDGAWAVRSPESLTLAGSARVCPRYCLLPLHLHLTDQVSQRFGRCYEGA